MVKGLLLANAVAGAARTTYSKPAALNDRRSFAGDSIFAPINYIRNLAQGACAGLLTLIGTLHLTAPGAEGQQAAASLTQFDGASLEGLIEASLAGGLPGMIEILGAAALFLSAGRGSGRLIGLLGFIAILVGHANGVTHEDILQQAGELVEFVQQTAQKIQATQNA